MRSIQVTLYRYDELSTASQAKARDWYMSGFEFDPEMESYETAAKLLGISPFNPHRSGFSSQGSGASFSGSYAFNPGAREAVRVEFPTAETLHDIADRLAEIDAYYALPVTCDVEQEGRYVHSRTMSLSNVEPASLTGVNETLLLSLLRYFADWIYESLRDEFDGEHEDEVIAENIRANEYEFTADGARYSA